MRKIIKNTEIVINFSPVTTATDTTTTGNYRSLLSGIIFLPLWNAIINHLKIKIEKRPNNDVSVDDSLCLTLFL